MVAQVLAEQDQTELTAFEWSVLSKLRSYTKPIKTKHLASRLNTDRPGLVSALNRLRNGGLIYWHVPKRLDEKQYYGWLCV